ncbi:MAG TPA: ABC transporter permease [Humisphaera sp.]
MSDRWFAIRRDPPPARSLLLKVASFLVPLGLWCVVSYVPFVWHPLARVTDLGDLPTLPDARGMFEVGQVTEPEVVEALNKRLKDSDLRPVLTAPANPVFLPAPHEVGRAFYTAFATAPQRVGDVWLHEALANSLKVILIGFGLAAVVGTPVGLLCGTYPFFSRLIEPFVDFVRYMPPPVFGALAIAVVGVDVGPKIAIVFIGTVFCLIRVVANTTRQLDPALLEAAQTLGASRRRLVTGVILPGVLPNLYNDLRILLGSAWTLLTAAELIGVWTGVSFFVIQQGKFRHYDNVFAGIVMIGLLGLAVDMVLSVVGGRLFPWQGKPAVGFWGELWSVVSSGGTARRPSQRPAAFVVMPAEREPAPAVPVPMQIDAALASVEPTGDGPGEGSQPRRPDAATA